MEEDVPGMRGSGSQFWGGVLNTHFWFDPSRDIAGILMTFWIPTSDFIPLRCASPTARPTLWHRPTPVFASGVITLVRV